MAVFTWPSEGGGWLRTHGGVYVEETQYVIYPGWVVMIELGLVVVEAT